MELSTLDYDVRKMGTAIHKGECIFVMYMDLSKTFDTINDDLLLAKLRVYCFSTSALNLLYSYLKYRKQKVVINNKTSSSEVVIAGVPQGSIDGPLLFNLFINDLILFLYIAVLSNYADDNNLYAISNDKEETKRALVKDFQTVISWFYENSMILNSERCHYMCMGKDVKENETLQISRQQKMIYSKEVEILGIKIDRKLSFHQHIKSISKKAGQKLSALLRNSPYLKNDKKKVIHNTTIKSQFNYCPLVWMFCSRKSNNMINKVQERALRLTYKGNENKFQTLLNENKETSAHQRNLQFFMKEIYKIKNNYAPPIMHHLFQFRENTFNLRNFREIATHNKKTSNYGLETVSYRAPFLWAKLPSEYKNSTSLSEFKTKIKNWKGDEICPCRLCKVYLPNIGYV